MDVTLLHFYHRRGNIEFNNFNYRIANYQKIYSKSNLELDEVNIVFFKGKKFRNILDNKILAENYFSDKYLDAYLFEEDDKHYKFHMEFDLCLYYFLMNNVKSGLIGIKSLLEEEFASYKCENDIYKIPIDIYKNFYKSLPENSPIKNAIITLAETRSFAITSDEYLTVDIRKKKIEDILNTINDYDLS